MQSRYTHKDGTPFTKEEFIQKLKTDKEFNDEFGNKGIDQISDLIKQLKENPDSRRLLLSAWNASDLPHQVLPPCHYGFQVYTRELSASERITYKNTKQINLLDSNELFDFIKSNVSIDLDNEVHKECDKFNIPTRAISLMWNQRSVDTFLGLPFNIASYGLLLEIIAKTVNMVPDELIGNLGDVHLYSNHIEQAKEQIGRELTLDERNELLNKVTNREHKRENCFSDEEFDRETLHDCKAFNIPTRTREPFQLPELNINTEFWSTESGECGTGLLDAIKIFNSFTNDNFCKCLLEEDIQLSNYKSHEKINAPLSN